MGGWMNWYQNHWVDVLLISLIQAINAEKLNPDLFLIVAFCLSLVVLSCIVQHRCCSQGSIVWKNLITRKKNFWLKSVLEPMSLRSFLRIFMLFCLTSLVCLTAKFFLNWIYTVLILLLMLRWLWLEIMTSLVLLWQKSLVFLSVLISTF